MSFKETPIFKDFVTAISCAKKSAKDEFSQFWENFSMEKPKDVSRPRKNIYSRTTTSDPKKKTYVKDANVQTDTKRKRDAIHNSFEVDHVRALKRPKRDSTSPILYHPTSNNYISTDTQPDTIRENHQSSIYVRDSSNIQRYISTSVSDIPNVFRYSTTAPARYTATDLITHSAQERRQVYNDTTSDISRKYKSFTTTSNNSPIEYISYPNNNLDKHDSYTNIKKNIKTDKKSLRFMTSKYEDYFIPKTPCLIPSVTQKSPKEYKNASLSSSSLSPTSSSSSSLLYDNIKNPAFYLEKPQPTVDFVEPKMIEYNRVSYPMYKLKHDHARIRLNASILQVVHLRKADTIIDFDGTRRPNPFWYEIYRRR